MRKFLIVLLAVVPIAGVWAKLSPLAEAPDWRRLDAFQETITKADFVRLLDTVYAPGGEWRDFLSVSDDAVLIRTSPGKPPYLLRFAKSRPTARRAPVFWRPRGQLPAAEAGKPLAGLRIAIDPGHIGGYWAKMEERWFQIGNSTPVKEGDMTLKVARLLERRLEALGADVRLTRSKPTPVTSERPERLRREAADSLAARGEAATPEAIRSESERLFYRTAEIRRRAKIVNESIRPDLVLCLHFNAEAWGDPADPQLVDANHLHFLITGSFAAGELAFEDQRFEMLMKLLGGSYPEELAVSRSLARSMAQATGLPPFIYRSTTAGPVPGSSYIWTRNLLANRLFTCPVVYLEPYVMNSRLVFARIQAGDYDGFRNFGGVPRKSIYREYTDAIVEGLIAYYSDRAARRIP